MLVCVTIHRGRDERRAAGLVEHLNRHFQPKRPGQVAEAKAKLCRSLKPGTWEVRISPPGRELEARSVMAGYMAGQQTETPQRELARPTYAR
jgi:hypothetical protein